MKRTFTLAFLLTLFTLSTVAQGENLYDKYLKLAEQCSEKQEFQKAAENYTRAFLSNKDRGRIDHRYEAAHCWMMAAVPDSAFYQLERIANSGSYSNYTQISSDPVFEPLHSDKRWKSLLERVALNKTKWDEQQKQRQELAEKKLNKPLITLLDSIHFDDQNLRKQLELEMKEHGQKSAKATELIKSIQQKDSINLTKVRSILDQFGWLGPDEIGDKGNSTLFLVIQHSNLSTQTKYLPMLQAAVKEGKASPSQLALLEDRVAIGNGRRQLYGSQLMQADNTYYVLPIEDPDNVDKRRASMGLQPIAEYLKYYNLQWDLEKYKAELPEIEVKIKQLRKEMEKAL